MQSSRLATKPDDAMGLTGPEASNPQPLLGFCGFSCSPPARPVSVGCTKSLMCLHLKGEDESCFSELA